MPEKTQQFAQNIARSLIGEEAAHPAQPLVQMQGIRKSYYIGQPNELEILHGIDLTVYPGECEQEAMADAVLEVLRGQRKANRYTGVPVFRGFDWDKK